MADITMCPGENCSVRESCYRFCAKPGDMQSCMETPDDRGPDCSQFLSVRSDNESVRRRGFLS